MKSLLSILQKYNGFQLTNQLAIEIMGEVIRYGLYRPINTTSQIIKKWGNAKINEKISIWD